MQTDFHFYAVYALARAAGFKADHALVIAYASEHTDDAKYEHALDFRNGGRFQQVLTAHRYLDLRALNKATCYRIWMPFHFLPGNLGIDFYERLVTRAASAVAQRLIDDLLVSSSRPYLLHRLGVLLHCYADTWSHQNFLGLMRERMNAVKRLKVRGVSTPAVQAMLRGLRRRIKEYAVPRLGHAQAGSIPDEPYRRWSYTDHSGTRFEISNMERALDAAMHCHQVLLKALGAFPAYSQAKPLPWHDLAATFGRLFGLEADLAQRIASWRDAVAGGAFGWKTEKQDKDVRYDDRQWFKDAVSVEKTAEGKESYERKPGFESSDWKYFHDAAAFHRFTVLHEVLPEHGMICG
ncbi:MAG TPA: hypothetical protein ENN39_00100 [Desulfonatronum sp.]|nr:hypothetical protein [Desulfonatronum sp.]